MHSPSSSSFEIQVKFTNALNIVRSIPVNSHSLQPVAADKLQFYGLYKQATEGDINIPKPSSRKVVEYAKWKAWNRMKGFTPTEAQKLYIESLIQLLTELIYRYPNHEHISFIKKALHSLQYNEEEDIFQDACDPTEFELQEHFLNQIEADQLMQSPSSTSSSSYYYYPLTPVTSPGHYKSYVHPSDFLQTKDDTLLSEADTIDREVAAATANLSLSSPRHSPYTSTTKQLSSNMSTVTNSTSNSKKKKNSNRKALEKLQTEVAVLQEQMDRLRATLITKDNNKTKRSYTTALISILFKHFLANSAILCIMFYILYKTKSPIAYSIIDYMTPIIQAMIRKLLHKLIFWKITV